MNTLLQSVGALPVMLVAAVAGLGHLHCPAQRGAGRHLLVAVHAGGVRCAYFFGQPMHATRAVVVLALVTVWALRLAGYLALRNWNAPEDHRYQAIRARNEPGFTWKSLYLVFGLQAVLALVVAAPLLAAITAAGPLQLLDYAGAALVLAGLVIEAIGRRATRRVSRPIPASKGRVLDTRPVALQPAPQLFRRVLRLVGILPAGAGHRRLVDHHFAAADERAAAARVRCHAAREGHRHSPPRLCAVRRAHQCLFSRTQEASMKRRSPLAAALLAPAISLLAACQSTPQPDLPTVATRGSAALHGRLVRDRATFRPSSSAARTTPSRVMRWRRMAPSTPPSPSASGFLRQANARRTTRAASSLTARAMHSGACASSGPSRRTIASSI